MQKIKKGDEVIVIAGRSKGQRGNVLKRLEDGRLLVENVNMVKKHVKGNPRSGDAGGIIDQEAPIQTSNVMLYNPHTQKGDRVGFKMEIPRITKITLNMGVGEAIGDRKVMDNAVSDMEKFAGQKPIVRKVRKSVAVFKVRE